jgi:hypothetical protein
MYIYIYIYIIVRVTSFRTYIIWPKTRYTKPCGEIRTYDAEISSSSWTTNITSSPTTIVLKFGSKAPVKKLRSLSLSLSLSLRGGPSGFEVDWGVWAHWRRLRVLIGTSNEQQQLDKELWGSLLAMRRFWRSIGLCGQISVHDYSKTSSGNCAQPLLLLNTWDHDQDDPPAVQEKVPLFKASFFCKFLRVWTHLFYWSK